jgi:hypothetical protein
MINSFPEDTISKSDLIKAFKDLKLKNKEATKETKEAKVGIESIAMEGSMESISVDAETNSMRLANNMLKEKFHLTSDEFLLYLRQRKFYKKLMQMADDMLKTEFNLTDDQVSLFHQQQEDHKTLMGVADDLLRVADEMFEDKIESLISTMN